MSPTNIVGVDPHRRSFTAALLDERGALVGHEHFTNDTEGYAAARGWATSRGGAQRWGVENASGLGRHLAEFLVDDGCDVRDVPPHRTTQRSRGRNEGKSDTLDAQRVARETQTNSRLAHAFKRASSLAPDRLRDRIVLWHNARKSLVRVRVGLMAEIDSMVHDLPEHLRLEVEKVKTVRAKVNAFDRLKPERGDLEDPVTSLRLGLVSSRIAMLRDVIEQDKEATRELTKLVAESRTSLCEVVGIAPRAAAELLVEIGDVGRFTEAGFARYNGTAPIPASSGEGGDQPVRHRLSRGGNRRINAVIHRIAMIQLRFEPRARTLVENAQARGHTRREAMRILKRHLSNVIYRTMTRDARDPSSLT
jgi:transposase